MAEITIPRTGAHIRKLFEILSSNPDGLQAAEALKKLATVVEMTPYEAGLYESTGTRRFEKIIRFATVDCVKAGWLLKNKGVWSITDAGKKAMSAYPDPRHSIARRSAFTEHGNEAQQAPKTLKAWKNLARE